MEPEPPVTTTGNSQQDKPVGNFGEQIDFLKYLTYGLITVLAIAFVTLILNYFEGSKSSYENLTNQITTQNAKVEVLTEIDTQILLHQEGKDKIIYIPVTNK